MLVGVILILVAVVDLVVGLTVILPRVAEASRPTIRNALLGGSALAFVLGVLFLLNVF